MTFSDNQQTRNDFVLLRETLASEAFIVQSLGAGWPVIEDSMRMGISSGITLAGKPSWPGKKKVL
jgi:hypothetical protein